MSRREISWKLALRGIDIWRKAINRSVFTIVIPDYEERLLKSAVPAVEHYLELTERSNEKINIIYSDKKVKKDFVDSNLSINFTQLDKKEMIYLAHYMILSSKHFGAMCNENVRLISFDWFYGGQLRKIVESGLFSEQYLVTEMMLNRI